LRQDRFQASDLAAECSQLTRLFQLTALLLNSQVKDLLFQLPFSALAARQALVRVISFIFILALDR
jgi:hypothetical protein